MAHMVLKKGRYWELQQSYRDGRGRPRTRFVRYLGILGRIDWEATFAPGDGVDWHAIEQQELARMKKQEDAHAQKLEEQREAFKAATGLELPANPPGGPVSVEPSRTAPAPDSEPGPSAPLESHTEQSSEPGADATGTATPS